MNVLFRADKRLLSRVYLHGILMLALSGGASFVVGQYVLKPAFDAPTRPSTTWIARHMGTLRTHPERLSGELAHLAKYSDIRVSLFDLEGRLVASNEVPPAAPLSAAEVKRLRGTRTRYGDGVGAVALTDDAGQMNGYARMRYPSTALPIGIAAAQLVVALLVLAMVSVFLARQVARPIEQLARLARSFGAGDLSARSKFRREDEIGDLGRAFDEMADRIAAFRRSEKELLANVSHELRTPLARIRLALELLNEGDREKATRYFEDISDDLAELERLLDDVMTTARFDIARGAGGDSAPPLRLAPAQSGELLEAAVVRFRTRHHRRTLRWVPPASLPTIHADPALLRRVFDNLLDNAEKFSGADTAVTLAAAVQDGHLVIDVSDRGTGIPAEDLERVFEPFFRSDRSRTRATGGVGLGLAVVRRIVTAHGGRLEVTSAVGEGSRFRVMLPVASDGAAADDRASPPVA